VKAEVGGRWLEVRLPVPAGVAAGEEITVQLEDRWAAGEDAPGTVAARLGGCGMRGGAAVG
jgi:hypothetical protein